MKDLIQTILLLTIGAFLIVGLIFAVAVSMDIEGNTLVPIEVVEVIYR